MKQFLLSTLILLISSSALADDRRGPWGLQMPEYVVKSDSVHPNVPAGKVMLTGTVYYDMKGKDSVEVATLDRSVSTLSVVEGKYRMLLDADDTSIFCYRKNFGEVVVWNYDFKSGHHVEIDFYLSSFSKMVITAKPVIYMYAPTEVKVAVKIDPVSDLTFTYPKYDDGWDVLVNRGAGIVHDGQVYPYLFWEGEHEGYKYIRQENQVEGFIVAKEDVVPFLEEKLSELGLNTNEKTDFITYWGPKMSSKKFAMVQFIVGQDYSELVASIEIAPSPKNMKRIYMLCSPMDSDKTDFEIIPQELNGFDREGFTVVEWGGSVIDLKTTQL